MRSGKINGGARPSCRGFTLIELSIVLVIIGLLVGGVLVGQDLVRAAYVRAQITQIEKYNSAVNTFRGKFGYLPGDINAQAAAQFGFTPRGSLPGQGDGNGIIDGYVGGNTGGCQESTGETAMFWVDLTSANGLNLNLIDGSFSAASPTTAPGASITGTALGGWFPAGKIGRGNYVYVWNGLDGASGEYAGVMGGNNWFGLSSISSLSPGGGLVSAPSLTVQEAYRMDAKMDDGLPQSGRVMAIYNYYCGGMCGQGMEWASGASSMGSAVQGANAGLGSPFDGPTTSATSGSATTCYDNSTSADGQTASNGNPQHYSLEMSGGNGVNCALSFQFQ